MFEVYYQPTTGQYFVLSQGVVYSLTQMGLVTGPQYRPEGVILLEQGCETLYRNRLTGRYGVRKYNRLIVFLAAGPEMGQFGENWEVVAI